MTPIPTLPTISESKGAEQGGSSGGSSESGEPRNERRRPRHTSESNTDGKPDTIGSSAFNGLTMVLFN